MHDCSFLGGPAQGEGATGGSEQSIEELKHARGVSESRTIEANESRCVHVPAVLIQYRLSVLIRRQQRHCLMWSMGKADDQKIPKWRLALSQAQINRKLDE